MTWICIPVHVSWIDWIRDTGKRPECGEGLLTLSPEPPEAIKTRFELHKKGQDPQDITYSMTAEQFANAGFDSSKKTRVIIHGFISSGYAEPFENLRKAFLQEQVRYVITKAITNITLIRLKL